MIVITKSFEYQGDATGKDLGSTIFLDDSATVTVDGEKNFKVNQSGHGVDKRPPRFSK